MLRTMKPADAECIRKINAEQLGYQISLTSTLAQIVKLGKDKKHHYFIVYEEEQSHYKKPKTFFKTVIRLKVLCRQNAES